MKENAVLLALFLLSWAKPAMAQDATTIKIINSERQEVGQATLTDTAKGVVIGLTLRDKSKGISPGAHAFHIHTVGPSSISSQLSFLSLLCRIQSVTRP